MNGPVQPRVRLVSDLYVEEDREFLVLRGPGDARIRVSPAVSYILDSLRRGATVAELAETLRARFPGEPELDGKVRGLLARLRVLGFLEGFAASVPPAGRRLRVPIAGPARCIAAPLRLLPPLARGGLLLLLVVLALWAIGDLLTGHLRPSLPRLLGALDPLGVAAILLIAVPLHELGHAVACSLVGNGVPEAGILFRPNRIPRPFVEIAGRPRDGGRLAQLLVAGGGAFVDLLVAGVVAFVIVVSRGAAPGALVVAFWYCVSSFVLATSPLNPGDGRLIVNAVVGDELAAKYLFKMAPTPLVRHRAVWRARTFAFAHLLCTTAFFARFLA